MGFNFGAHSLDHANFDELSLEEQIYQAKTSIDFIKKVFNIDYSIFAFPFLTKISLLSFYKNARICWHLFWNSRDSD